VGVKFKNHIGVYEFARKTKQKVKDVYAAIRAGKLHAVRLGIKRVWQIPEPKRA
jgi:hypothetical protein